MSKTSKCRLNFKNGFSSFSVEVKDFGPRIKHLIDAY